MKVRPRLSDKGGLEEKMEAPLSGIRVLDLTRLWSGPLAGRILADLGAEVIHILGRATLAAEPVSTETARRLGIYPENRPGERPWDRVSTDNDFHRNKRGMTLELHIPEGAEVFKRLVGVSDVVLENFSPRVMPNFGLDYEELKKIRPDLIYCSLSGYGLTGPAREEVAYGSNIEAFSGSAFLTGYADGDPLPAGNPWPDAAAALHAVSAVLTALLFRRKTGQGQRIDLAQSESALCLMGEVILAFGLSQERPRRQGNRHSAYTPSGCYPCRGEDQWVGLAVLDEAERRALARLLGRSDGLGDEGFSHPRRRDRQEASDQGITAWTRRRDPEEAMTLLQEAGVPAGAVRSAEELLADRHLKERGFFVEVVHPEWGRRKYVRLPIGFSGCPPPPQRPAPRLGEDNEEILRGLLGLSEEEVRNLEKKGIIGNRP